MKTPLYTVTYPGVNRSILGAVLVVTLVREILGLVLTLEQPVDICPGSLRFAERLEITPGTVTTDVLILLLAEEIPDLESGVHKVIPDDIDHSSLDRTIDADETIAPIVDRIFHQLRIVLLLQTFFLEPTLEPARQRVDTSLGNTTCLCRLSRNVTGLAADIIPQDTIDWLETHFLHSPEVDCGLNASPTLILTGHTAERLMLDEPTHSLRFSRGVDLAGEPYAVVKLDAELMLAASTFELDRLEVALPILKVVGHDVADVGNQVTIHLLLTTEHFPVLEVDLVEHCFPVLTLEVCLSERVNEGTEDEWPLLLFLLQSEHELVVERTTALTIQLDLRLTDVDLTVLRQDARVILRRRVTTVVANA